VSDYIKIFPDPITQQWSAELRQANHHVVDGRSDFPTAAQAELVAKLVWGDLPVTYVEEPEAVRLVVIKAGGGWKRITNDTVVEESDHTWPTNESVVDAASRFPGIPILMEEPLTTDEPAIPRADEPQDARYGDPVPDRPPIVSQG
jgi:hypothetical protein